MRWECADEEELGDALEHPGVAPGRFALLCCEADVEACFFKGRVRNGGLWMAVSDDGTMKRSINRVGIDHTCGIVAVVGHHDENLCHRDVVQTAV